MLFTQPDIDARLVVMSEMDKLNLDVRYDNKNVNTYIYIYTYMHVQKEEWVRG